jgi:hypothetical protein
MSDRGNLTHYLPYIIQVVFMLYNPFHITEEQIL